MLSAVSAAHIVFGTVLAVSIGQRAAYDWLWRRLLDHSGPQNAEPQGHLGLGAKSDAATCDGSHIWSRYNKYSTVDPDTQ